MSGDLIYWWFFTHLVWGVLLFSSLICDFKIGLFLSLIPAFASLFIALKIHRRFQNE